MLIRTGKPLLKEDSFISQVNGLRCHYLSLSPLFQAPSNDITAPESVSAEMQNKGSSVRFNQLMEPNPPASLISSKASKISAFFDIA
ncbi:hypothetical protein PGRAT_28630 [Paenibacillus graminis]|uniref:Uncharacterized protein n=1 Tax=Paenibacillus graminis TaxID=189425 RepID=A0A089MHW7_9BACL|nr:hypothetical protein PGRAT_28630 [Paenibacillus graminis]